MREQLECPQSQKLVMGWLRTGMHAWQLMHAPVALSP